MLDPTKLRHFSRIIMDAPATLFKKGLERECMRVDEAGYLSKKPHPESLGHPLTHSCFTTDFSEAMLEIVSPVFDHNEELITWLNDAHAFVNQTLEDEYLWPNSMPANHHRQIPVAQFGESHIGRTKSLYRSGLVYRYGAWMQLIQGTHFNISFSAELTSKWLSANQLPNQSVAYMSIVRNLHRCSWLFPLLFGHSQQLIRAGEQYDEPLIKKSQNSWYAPDATTLRLSRFGYQTEQQQDLNIDHNEIDRYIKTLHSATCPDTHPFYENISLEKQISTAKLQLENEFYSLIRPKAVPQSGKKTIDALAEKGVEYIEMRVLDSDPQSPIGVERHALNMLELVFVVAAVMPDAPLSLNALNTVRHSTRSVALYGRNPDLHILDADNQTINVHSEGLRILEAIKPLAKLLDQNSNLPSRKTDYQEAVWHYEELLSGFPNKNKEQVPDFIKHHLGLAKKHQELLKTRPVNQDRFDDFKKLSKRSLQDATSLESNSLDMRYDAWLARYLNCDFAK